MLPELEFPHDDLTLYCAGQPRFLSNFSRDAFISGFLFEDPKLLSDQITFSAQQQGDKVDSLTGEEAGKIHHEIPEVAIRAHTTRYTACDTTALFILAHKKYQELTGDNRLLRLYRDNIQNAYEYIKKHVHEGFFWESPSFSGATKFALKVTYWKDSEIIERPNHEPAYPICYTLAHVMNMAAVRYFAKEFKNTEAQNLAQEMLEVLQNKLFKKEKGEFLLAYDQLGEIMVETSDCLHMLYYLEKSDLNQQHLEAIIDNASNLATTHGFRTMIADFADEVEPYHAKTVWPFEQAIIHAGAVKFGLDEIAKTASRVVKFLDTNNEIFVLNGDKTTFHKAGCDPQLWTVAARSYFKRVLETNNLD